MAIISRRHRRSSEDEEEGYFVSMTDMMVGLLFLFIIMLMLFVLKYEQAAVNHAKTTVALTSAEETRAAILKSLKAALEQEGITVEIDTQNGVLRLPERILFDRGRADLSLTGQAAVSSLGHAFATVLPCFATVPGTERPTTCPDTPHSIEAILIEGHTDADGSAELNWNLSVQRALGTFKALTASNPGLVELQNKRGQAILSVSGYGRERPVRPNDSDDNKRMNRRIDVRFIMLTPRPEEIEEVERRLNAPPSSATSPAGSP
jgi:outer membrane protein OmpA-like peptidoglycan-associated protein